MSRLRVHSFSISIDGYGAGPNQDLENPLGVRGLRVFDWFFSTRLGATWLVSLDKQIMVWRSRAALL
jgi:hypothetical protein